LPAILHGARDACHDPAKIINCQSVDEQSLFELST
jgi:hypothetical protein